MKTPHVLKTMDYDGSYARFAHVWRGKGTGPCERISDASWDVLETRALLHSLTLSTVSGSEAAVVLLN